MAVGGFGLSVSNGAYCGGVVDSRVGFSGVLIICQVAGVGSRRRVLYGREVCRIMEGFILWGSVGMCVLVCLLSWDVWCGL